MAYDFKLAIDRLFSCSRKCKATNIAVFIDYFKIFNFNFNFNSLQFAVDYLY